jgi:hypothetical protein
LEEKAWGRADRYFVKLYEEETNLSCNILLDCSKSMVYGEGQEGMSKFDYGATVAASLAFLLQHQQDAVGAVLFDNDIRTVIPPRASARQAYALVHALEQCRPDHRSDVDTVFTRLPAQIRRRGVVVIISDLFLDLTRLETMLQQFGHQRPDRADKDDKGRHGQQQVVGHQGTFTADRGKDALEIDGDAAFEGLLGGGALDIPPGRGRVFDHLLDGGFRAMLDGFLKALAGRQEGVHHLLPVLNRHRGGTGRQAVAIGLG